MTRKDYELIAAAFTAAKRVADYNSDRAVFGVEIAADSVADALATDNPRFDRARFLAACGF